MSNRTNLELVEKIICSGEKWIGHGGNAWLPLGQTFIHSLRHDNYENPGICVRIYLEISLGPKTQQKKPKGRSKEAGYVRFV
jgi:hypothetical protein